MKLKITEIVGKVIEIQRMITTIRITPFDAGVGSVKLADFTAKGDMVVGKAAGEIVVKHVGNDGEVWTADSTAEGGAGWKPGGGSMVQKFTNKDAANILAGDVVIFDHTNDQAVKKTTIAGDTRKIGVAAEGIAPDTEGNINTVAGTVVTVNCDTAAVARGQYLKTSATAGKATAAGYFPDKSVFALAVTAKAAGSTGTVKAMITIDITKVVDGVAGWAPGGWNGTTHYSETQKFIFAAGAWGTVSSAALPIPTYSPGSVGGDAVAGYIGGGANNSTSTEVDAIRKLLYSTEAFSTISGVLAAVKDDVSRGMGCATHGYFAGGDNSGAIASVNKLIYATDAVSTITALSAANANCVGLSNNVNGYAINATFGNKYAFATDARSTITASLTALTPYASFSFPGDYGYLAANNGSGTAATHRLSFASDAFSSVGSQTPGTHIGGQGICDNITTAWVSGSENGAASTDEFDKAVEAFSALSGGAMAVGKGRAGYFNFNAV